MCARSLLLRRVVSRFGFKVNSFYLLGKCLKTDFFFFSCWITSKQFSSNCSLTPFFWGKLYLNKTMHICASMFISNIHSLSIYFITMPPSLSFCLFIFHLCVFRFKYFSVTFGITGSIRGMFYQVKKVVKCQAENQPLMNYMWHWCGLLWKWTVCCYD